MSPIFAYPAQEELSEDTRQRDFRLLCFNVPKLMKEWRKNTFTSLSKTEFHNNEGTYDILNRVKTKHPIGVPLIRYVTDENFSGMLDITDGRHRTMMFADWFNLQYIPALVLKEQADAFLKNGMARKATFAESRAIIRQKPFPLSQMDKYDL